MAIMMWQNWLDGLVAKIRHSDEGRHAQEQCGSCPVIGRHTLAFALQLWKKYGKTSVKVLQIFQLIKILYVHLANF